MPRPDRRNLTAEQRSEIARRAGKARAQKHPLTREDYARMGRKGAAVRHARVHPPAELMAERFRRAQTVKRLALSPIEEHTAP